MHSKRVRVNHAWREHPLIPMTQTEWRNLPLVKYADIVAAHGRLRRQLMSSTKTFLQFIRGLLFRVKLWLYLP